MAGKKTSVIAEMINENLDVKYDEFSNEINIMKGKVFVNENVEIESGRMTDNKAILLQTMLERKYDIALTGSKLYEAIAMAASQHVYSSAYDWIEAKEWDGKPRLWDIATKLFGNDNPDLNKALGIWVINIVNGAYGGDTGKFQYSLDIIGQQGTGKTTFLKRLGGSYYTDQFMSFTQKDSFEVMLKNLVINDDEMQVTEISREKAFKKFVSTSEFMYRPAYGRNPLVKSRHFVIARTTNDYEYLTDVGGNRRIIPLIVNKNKIKTPAFALPDDWFDNLLGEAKEYYIKKNAEIETINRYMRQISFDALNSNLNIYAEIDDAILDVISHDFVGAERIPVTSLQNKVEGNLIYNSIDFDNRKLKKMINDVMAREDYIKKPVWVNGKSVRAYVK